MSEPAVSNTVTLGEESYELQPQPYPRVFRQLSEFGEELQSLGEADVSDVGGLVAALGGRVHAFLRIFIPDLMGEHRFAGYATREAYEAGELDEQAEAKAPTVPQIVAAVETAFEVNGGKRLGELLGKLLGPAMGQAARKLVAARISEMLSQESTSSPSLSGGPTGASSTPQSRTPADAGPADGSSPAGPASVASPSLVSSPS